MACEEHFFKLLRERGLRLTPQLEMVLAVLHEIEGLASAEEIYDRVRAISSSVDVSTVYRNLELLQEFHLVASVEAPDGQRRYELVGVHGAHMHLVCRSCGRIQGVSLDQFEAFMTYLKEKHDFVVDIEHLSIQGLCRDCASPDTD